MIGVLIVTHGRLASELLAAAEIIAGALPNFRALSLDWSEGLDDARERIASAITAVDEGEGVLVLTDMFGDTPSNAARGLYREGRVEVLSGVNLPMVVRLGCLRTTKQTLGEAAQWLESKGRRSIRRAGSGCSDSGNCDSSGDEGG